MFKESMEMSNTTWQKLHNGWTGQMKNQLYSDHSTAVYIGYGAADIESIVSSKN